VEKPVSKIFISYSSDAKTWAKRLSESLESKGVSIWTDLKDLEPGADFDEKIQDALHDANCFVIVIGPKNRIGQAQDLEIQAALKSTWADSRKRIVPVLVGDKEPPSFLKNWLPVRLQPGEPESSWTDKIYDAITRTGSEERENILKRAAKPTKEFQTRLEGFERTAKGIKSIQEK
jgi:hypothetical protein